MFRLILTLLFLVSCSGQKVENKKGPAKSMEKDFEALNEDRFKEFRLDPKETYPPKSIESVKEQKPAKSPKAGSTKVSKQKTKPVRQKKKSLKKKVVKNRKAEKPISVLPPNRDEKKRPKAWRDFTPNPIIGEKIRYAISYMGIKAGEVVFTTRRENLGSMNPVLHFQLKAESSSYYSFIYRVKDTLDVYVNPETYLPLRYSLVQDESKKQVKDLQLFDHAKGEMHFFYKRLKKGQIKKINFTSPIPPYFLDLATPFYFIRGMKLSRGASYKIPMIKKGKVGHLQISVEGRDTIESVLGEKAVVEVKLVPSFPTSKSKANVIRFWLTDDQDRIPLKFQGESKIGPIKGQLLEYAGYDRQ